ncbi:MAG: HAD-IA family hydrolase [Bacteroidota bacterium]
MQIKLTIFDLVGTTVYDDGFVKHTLFDTLRDHGVFVGWESIGRVMGLASPQAIERLTELRLGSDKEFEKAKMEEIYQDFLSRMKHFYLSDPQVCEIEGTTELFQHLRESGIKIGVETGLDRQVTDAILNRLGWYDKIDFSVSSDDVKLGRPSPDMIFKAMEMAGISDPLEVMKVGDTIYDIIQGNAAGCGIVVGVTTGSYLREELAVYNCTRILESLTELPAQLNSGKLVLEA